MEYVFLENENTNEDYNHAIRVLKDIDKFSNITKKNTTLVNDLRGEVTDELFEQIVINKDSVIVTHSVFTNNFGINSKYQLLKMLKRIGRNRIKNLTYVNTNSYLLNALNYIEDIDGKSNLIEIIRAVAQNNIYLVDHDDFKLYRIVVDFEQDYEIFKKLEVKN